MWRPERGASAKGEGPRDDVAHQSAFSSRVSSIVPRNSGQAAGDWRGAVSRPHDSAYSYVPFLCSTQASTQPAAARRRAQQRCCMVATFSRRDDLHHSLSATSFLQGRRRASTNSTGRGFCGLSTVCLCGVCRTQVQCTRMHVEPVRRRRCSSEQKRRIVGCRNAAQQSLSRTRPDRRSAFGRTSCLSFSVACQAPRHKRGATSETENVSHCSRGTFFSTSRGSRAFRTPSDATPAEK